jgi:hypothetical protein
MVLAWRGNGPVVVSSSGKGEVWGNITIRAWYITLSVLGDSRAEIAFSTQVSAPMTHVKSDARAVFPNLARCDDKYR